MLDALNPFQNNAIQKRSRAEIELWNEKVEENKHAVSRIAKNLRRSMNMTKHRWWKPIDAMVNEKLQAEIAEFVQDPSNWLNKKLKYAIAMKEDPAKLKGFVFERLKPNSELHADPKVMAENFRNLRNRS